MNNKEAHDFQDTKASVSEGTNAFLDFFHLEESNYDAIRMKFRNLISDRVFYRKKNEMTTWEEPLFYDVSSPVTPPEKRRLLPQGELCIIQKNKEVRKPLLELTAKGQRVRVEPLLAMMNTIAEKENLSCKTIAALTLQLATIAQAHSHKKW